MPLTQPARRSRVVFWDNLPAPYGVEQYNALAAKGDLDFTVWFSRRTDPGRGWVVDPSQWRFDAAYVEDPSEGLAAAAAFIRRCRTSGADLIVCLYHERPFLAAFPILKALGFRVVFVVEASFDAVVRRSLWKELAKSVLFRAADGAHAGPGALEYAARYGFTANRVFIVKQTTNLALFGRELASEQRHQLRGDLRLRGCVFAYVGRLSAPKGIFVLIEAFGRVLERTGDVSLLIIGDGEDERAVRDACRDLERVVFCGFIQRDDLPRYYGVADVLVFPTFGDAHGHVVEEAHAAGLPVITTNAAGGIRSRVEDGVSGFVVPPGDSAALAERMVLLARDGSLRDAMAHRGMDRVRSWGHDTYVAEIARLVAACRAAPRRSTIAALAVSTLGRAMIYIAARCGSPAPRAVA